MFSLGYNNLGAYYDKILYFAAIIWYKLWINMQYSQHHCSLNVPTAKTAAASAAMARLGRGGAGLLLSMAE